MSTNPALAVVEELSHVIENTLTLHPSEPVALPEYILHPEQTGCPHCDQPGPGQPSVCRLLQETEQWLRDTEIAIRPPRKRPRHRSARGLLACVVIGASVLAAWTMAAVAH